ncbi:hypothetical protein HY214_01275 [Candidatus Roizmanbacteria bacterium]|nr:hypothetical protein [Candidatus Roizmanbacteria bacterium]
MLKKSTTITFVFIFSTVIQLISQMVVTRMFGATTNLDIFLASVTLPTIFVTLIYSTLNDAFLPLYGDHRSDEYFFSHLALLTFISTIFTGILVFFSPLLADLLYHARGQVFVRQVATQLTIMTWSIPFAVITTLLGSYYYLRKNFLRFPVSQVFGSIFNLIFILLFARVVGIWALILSFILNIIFQIIFIVPKNLFQIKFKTVAIKPLLIAWIPLLIGTFALRSDALIIRSFGSSLPSGYLVYLNLVSKIFSLATSVMTIGLQVVLLPHLIDYISQRDYTHAFRYIFKAKVAALVIAVVITFILITVSPFFINLLFVGGKFTKADASLTIRLLLPFSYRG